MKEPAGDIVPLFRADVNVFCLRLDAESPGVAILVKDPVTGCFEEVIANDRVWWATIPWPTGVLLGDILFFCARELFAFADFYAVPTVFLFSRLSVVFGLLRR